MVFLKSFSLVSSEVEYGLICTKKNVFNSLYPFNIFTSKEFKDISFEPITIFYGGNGSGKTTLLNIIADKMNASKKNNDTRGEMFTRYVSSCFYELNKKNSVEEIKYIASDDVFDYLLDMRAINSNVNRRKEEISKEYLHSKYDLNSTMNLSYEELKNSVDARKMTHSAYIRDRLINNNVILRSNGESALEFWQGEIKENGIYLLDEPENSLSAENQVKLKKFIEESVRFFNCQFIISTHSPFLLSLDGACIYDLDSIPVKIRNWTELENVKVYYSFFKKYENEFK